MFNSFLDQLNEKYKIDCPKCGETMKIRTTQAGIPIWEAGKEKYEVCCFCDNVHHTFGISYNATLAIEQAMENVEKALRERENNG